MPPAARGGRGGGRGGRGGAFNPARGTVTIAGTELNWDLTGLDIQKGPAERFPVSLPLSYRDTTYDHSRHQRIRRLVLYT
jgi:DNA-directed RNA polymerase III subunit RPC7